MSEIRDILIIGNGFDLHCGLPTRYSDFLFFLTNWNKIYYSYKNIDSTSNESESVTIKITLGADNELTEKSIEDFCESIKRIDPKTVIYINNHINNMWIKYLKQLHNENKGWIDFEKDIEDALHKIEQYYTYLDTEWRKMTKFAIDNTGKYAKVVEVFNLLKGDNPDFMDIPPVDYDTIYNAKKELISELRIAIDELENILYLYLKDFVGIVEQNNTPPLKFDEKNLYILSFNYTNTAQKIYELDNERCHYVHGNLGSELYESKNGQIIMRTNLVLGIDDNSFENSDYIYFQKFFQRIQKKTGSNYREWIPIVPEGDQNIINVHIYGHSLDKTDKTVFEYWFKNGSIINIYIRSQDDYETKVINLTDMFGKEFIIENIGKKRIRFITIED